MKIFCYQYGGVNVDVQRMKRAVYVTFSPYRPGMAPALILNHTNDVLSFSQKDSSITMYVHVSNCSLVLYIRLWTLKLSV
jgi:hypothetical protein